MTRFILIALFLSVPALSKPIELPREGLHRPRVHPVKIYYDHLPVIGAEIRKMVQK